MVSIIAPNQCYKSYWKRIKTKFHERKLIIVECRVMKHNQKAMSSPWVIIQGIFNTFHGYVENIRSSQESGVNAKLQLDLALDMYRSNNKGNGFHLMHCFTKLKTCEKWRLTRIQLKKAGNVAVDLDGPLATSVGRPTGNKKANAAVL
jgi:hypothetical protein